MQVIRPKVELLWITPEPLKAIEKAGRTCYKSEEKITETSSSAFVAMLNSKEHGAMIEHASASLRFVCDRGVTHEIVRHRLASYAQESTRYCNYAKEKFGREIGIIMPNEHLTPAQVERRIELMTHIEKVYMSEIDEGVTPQIARGVLPTCLKTEIVMTANFREWQHFFKLRTSKAAHPQMREVAAMALEILSWHVKGVFDKYLSNVDITVDIT
jgi:thymidylate synthase (FAD)